ncbi:hypothetical protein MRX96_057655 [Rhipicephalus microplus]
MEGGAAEFVGAVFPDALCVSLRRRQSEALTSPPPIAAASATARVSCTELEAADTLRQPKSGDVKSFHAICSLCMLMSSGENTPTKSLVFV